MKKKLLVSGINTDIVKEFIEHSDVYFQCISTTDCLKDIKLHFEIFKPDGYLIFPESAKDSIITQIKELRDESVINCPVFVCAPTDVCEIIHNIAPNLTDLVLKRPVSADNLLLRINKYFENPSPSAEFSDIEKSSCDYSGKDKNCDNISSFKRKKHILIIDDDRLILKMLKSALEEEYEVTTMVNGVLVEKFLSSKSVDLIILDYEMPVKTGVDVIRELRSSDKLHGIPICFLTGIDQSDKIMEILSLKPDAYMLKPVNMNSLLATVSNLVD